MPLSEFDRLRFEYTRHWRQRRISFSLLLCLILVACDSGDSSNESNPTEPDIGEAIAMLDQSVTAAIHDDILGTSAEVIGRRLTADPPPGNDWYDAILTGDASWSTHLRPNGCAILPDDPEGRTLRCTNPFDNTYSGSSFDGDERVFFHPLYIDTPADSEISVNIIYGATEQDRNPSDNQASDSVFHFEYPPAAFGLDAPMVLLTHPDETATLRVVLTQTADAFPRNAQLLVELPDQAVVTSANILKINEPYEDKLTPNDCHIAEAVSCELVDLKPGESYQAELQLRASGASTDPIRLTFANSDPDADDPTITKDIHVEHVRSMTVIQAMLDNAEEGSSIELPAGIFGGSLAGGDKKLDVSGANGSEPTILLAGVELPLVTSAGPRSTWSGLVLRSFGAPILGGELSANFTLSDSVIEPANPDIHALDDGLVTAHRRTSYRLLNNTIRHWGTSASSRCPYLLEVTTHSAAIYLQHNVFDTNNCGALIESTAHPGSKFSDYDHVWLIASNNTFVDNPTLIRLLGEPAASRSLEFRNNIVVGSEVLFDISDEILNESNKFLPDNPWLLTARNLLWDNTAQTLFDARQTNLPKVAVELSDLHADPHFIDPSSGDYSLAAFSPALDAGTNPGEYRWYRAFTSCRWLMPCNEPSEPEFAPDEYPQPGPEAVIQPVDGNGDGVAEYDIGAVEYRP